MIPLDYGRSFLIGKVASNEVRFWVESRTRVIDEERGTTEDYIQTGSCKSEHTFAEQELFHEDNYDFLPVFGPEHGVIYRRKARLNPGYKSVVATPDMWGGQDYHLAEASSWEELTDLSAVLDATRTFDPIVAQTEIWHEETRLRAVIEYPVKTMNTRRDPIAYQVDTGPIVFPDLTRRHTRTADGLSLAFVAFNAAHFADFILEVPTPVADGVQIHHYAQRLSLTAINRLFAVLR
jgi:hypothetical protein